MLFLAGLGSTHPLIPEVPSKNPVPRGPSGRVPRGWDGRVPRVPEATRVPARGLQQTMLVAYPTFEPTFPPPRSVRSDWTAPRMHMMNGLGGLGATAAQGRAALQRVYDVTMERLEPFVQWVQGLPEGQRGSILGVVLDQLRPGGGVRVDQTFQLLVAGRVHPSIALRRALAKEFAATIGNPNARAADILGSGIGFAGLSGSADDVRAGVNTGAAVARDISCNEGIQDVVSVGLEWASDGDVVASDTERVLEQTCRAATVAHRVTESAEQRRAREQREAAPPPPPQPSVGRRAPPPRRPTRAQQRAAVAELNRRMQVEQRGLFRGQARRITKVNEDLGIQWRPSDRDIAFLIAQRAPVQPKDVFVPEAKSNLPWLLAGGAGALYFGWKWMQRRKAPGGGLRVKPSSRTARAAETLV